MKQVVKILLLLIFGCVVSACRGADTNHDDDMVGVGITGIDHLADHLSVQQFYVDGYNAFQAGKGGRHVCCAMLPEKWRPGLSVEVRWNVTNWRDCSGEDFVRRVPVEQYTEVGTLYVHFFADGKVRVVSSNSPAWKGNSPESKYPIKEKIPQKLPWKVYSLEETCKGKEFPKEGRK